jgi:hypothetical protein
MRTRGRDGMAGRPASPGVGARVQVRIEGAPWRGVVLAVDGRSLLRDMLLVELDEGPAGPIGGRTVAAWFDHRCCGPADDRPGPAGGES